jgi:DNA-binding response OmpR family regulator
VMVTVIDEHSLGYSLGASDYLLKPVEWDRLKTVVDRLSLSGPATILAVDDDPDHLERTAQMLGRAGYAVETAANGREGLEKAAVRRPDLVLLDLVMPELDGFGFLRAFRDRPEWAGIPVVVLSSKDITRDDWKTLNGRVDKVLPKGEASIRDLAAQLRTVLDAKAVEPA